MGPESSRGRGIERPRAGAAFRLPRRSRDRFRRRFFDRANRAHRRQELPVLLRVSQVEVAHRRLAAQSLHHPPRQQVDVLCRRVHRPLRFPRRGADGLGTYYHRDPAGRLGSAARGELPPSLRDDAARLVRQPRRTLGRRGRRGRSADRQGVGPVHGGFAGGLRTKQPAATSRIGDQGGPRGDDSLPLRPWWQP